MEKDRCTLYRFGLLVMLPVLVQLKGQYFVVSNVETPIVCVTMQCDHYGL